jgi:fibrillarin-like pre-rRNA processing protein
MTRIKKCKFPNVFHDGDSYFTKNLSPGHQVYGEKIVTQDGVEYRIWNPRRSKLSAMLNKGCKFLPLKEGTDVLYLGAANGTTASHISDIAIKGAVYCIEFSPRAFRDLLEVCNKRKNMIPILADANHPKIYSAIVEKVDCIYQDISQRNQTEIFLKNILAFLKPKDHGILMVKSRSIDVTAVPKTIFKDVERELKRAGLHVLASIDISPYEKDHAAIIVKNKSD